MGWGWKAIGVGVGAAFGGPIGAGIGAAIGHVIDSASDEDISENDAAIVLVGCFLGRFSFETGQLNETQREFIAKICDEVSDNSALTREKVLSNLDEWAKNDELFGKVIQAAQSDEDIRRGLLTFGWRAASRDNRIDDHELAWLTQAAEVMGATEEELYFTMIPYLRQTEGGNDQEISDARDLFDISPNATKDEINKRYRELSIKYHPDSHATASDALKELAAERFSKISAAYELLRSSKQPQFWGVCSVSRQLFKPKSRELTHCFFCGQKCRLPQQENFAFSRCPKCQALLLFEEELAHAVFDSDAPQTNETRTPARGVTVSVISNLLGGFTNSRVFLAPNIPADKLNNAVNAYGCGVPASDVLLLYDDTLWGGAREGVMITKDSVCLHNIGEDPVRLRYGEVQSVSHVASALFQNACVVVNGKQFYTNTADNESAVAEKLAYLIRSLIAS